MKILFIGGTGLISSACSDLVLEHGFDLTLLNRGRSDHYPVPAGARHILLDMQKDRDMLFHRLAAEQFDVVVDWIAYTRADVERDLELFKGRTGQFVFISSASAYQKPPVHYRITEETPLDNPFWQYSRDKIACEKRLMQAYQEDRFPVTIVRPSLTYGPSMIPLCVNSWQHPYTILDRIKRGKKSIVPGDGTSLWTLTWNGDFAGGLVGLLGNPGAVGEAFHITSDEVLTWDQIYLETFNALGVEPALVHIPSDLLAAYDNEYAGSLLGDKSYSMVFDNTKIKRCVPEFQCAVSWHEGVRRAIDWFNADPARQTIDIQAGRTWDTILAHYLMAFPVR